MKTDWQMVAALVSAFAAVIYTIGTLLLWWTTERALRAARDAFRLNFLIALHSVDESVADEVAGLEPWVAAREIRRERTLTLLQKVFPDVWRLLASPNQKSSLVTSDSRHRDQA